ncbi:glycoside hydrolase family 2 protein [Sunxiuqinia sp. A32]|uniref:glycoside hydrolase family 2 protein n=1 Tax=Sunxiuqinia sp. A32 TaxID=3461496 RepID=UPI004045663B
MKKRIKLISILMLTCLMVNAEWKPNFPSIATRWGKAVTPENAWQEYPRPQMVRDAWMNLNGLWDYAVVSKSQKESPANWDGQILVPYSIEAPLSGVGKQVTEEDAIWYKRSFNLPEKCTSEKFLLHFEASDFETSVWLNGKLLGTHEGGYQPFSFQVDAGELVKGDQTLIVRVYDPQETGFRSLGKQGSRIEHYERCSGIWQTVWLEPVSEKAFINSLKIKADLKEVSIESELDGNDSGILVKYEVSDGASKIGSVVANPGEPAKIKIPSAKHWSPESPFLYDLKVSLLDGSKVVDEVKSYFGMRTIELAKSKTGTDILLNGKSIFQMGPLDQNYWPDGGLTPPSDEAMKWEAEYLKRIGCNMVRLHIKENPRRFYYHCDQLGLLVWQDFVCGSFNMKNPERTGSDFWFNEQKELIKTLYNSPAIILWVIFNESWGQHESKRIYEQVKPLDDTRLFSIASGWNDVPGVGNIRDIHDYTFRPAIPALGEDSRVVVLGECGGFASAVPGHNWTGRSNKTGTPPNPLHGGFDPEIPRDDNTKHDVFRPTFTIGEPFQNQYLEFVEHLHLLKNSGLRAAVYTQMTDMKLEENGWLTFDREVSKIQPDSLGVIHEILYTETPKQTVVLHPSMHKPQDWEMVTMPIEEIKDWAKNEDILDALALQKVPDFEDLEWTKQVGPFGNVEVPKPATSWDGRSQLLIRKSVQIDHPEKGHTVRIYTRLEGKGTPWMHARIYLNGEFVADETTRQKMPELRMAEVILPNEVKGLLKKGENSLTVQFIPGLVLRSGKIMPGSEKVFVDVELTEIED